MKIYKDVTELVGNTPLVAIDRFVSSRGIRARIVVKTERQNPGGSVKDRIALYMLTQAEARGELKKGGTVIEPTSGNTGIGIAMVAAVKGYRAIMVMPSSMSIERQKLIKSYGAEIVLTEPSLGMKGAVDKAAELNKNIPGSIIASQFTNPDNPFCHETTTGKEIYRDTDGTIAAFVAGVGSSGTITGVSRYLKSQNPAIVTVAVEPQKSPLLSGGKAASHGIQGIGANFIPPNYDASVVDRVVSVADEDAFDTARALAKEEGLLVGISSGAAVSAAVRLAATGEFDDKLIVVILPDTGERYLSTPLFDL